VGEPGREAELEHASTALGVGRAEIAERIGDVAADHADAFDDD
jgi:hypothetical protein